MKNNKTPLDFKNVCHIRAVLSIAVQDAVKSHKETKRYWGVQSAMTKMSRQRIGDTISAYRAAYNIEIVY